MSDETYAAVGDDSPIQEEIDRRNAEQVTRHTTRAQARQRLIGHVRAAADGTSADLIQAAAVEAVVYELAQLGDYAPEFQLLAGFGSPLPDWAVPPEVGAAGFQTAVKDRVAEILKALRGAADEQVAVERVGVTFYGHR